MRGQLLRVDLTIILVLVLLLSLNLVGLLLGLLLHNLLLLSFLLLLNVHIVFRTVPLGFRRWDNQTPIRLLNASNLSIHITHHASLMNLVGCFLL